VRGLGPQFTGVRLNGLEAMSSVGSSDGQGGANRGRGFDFNVFASDLFSQLIVRKTASADVEEGSLGATVDLRTGRPFDYDGFTASATLQATFTVAPATPSRRSPARSPTSGPAARFAPLAPLAIPNAKRRAEAPATGQSTGVEHATKVLGRKRRGHSLASPRTGGWREGRGPPGPGPLRGRSRLAGFVLLTLAWLPVTFALWYFAAPALIAIVRFLAGLAVLPFGDLVRGIEQSGSTLVFVPSLKPGQSVAGGVVSVSVDGLLYSFGMPMFAALVLAAREPGWWKKLLIGYVALLPVVAFGVVADFLKNIAITVDPLVASQAGFSALQREVIAFAFQFGSLILPTVVPAILWVLLDRGFLERMRGRMAAAEKPETAT